MFRDQKHIDDSNKHLDIVKPVSYSKIPHWKLLKSKIDIHKLTHRKLVKICCFPNRISIHWINEAD